MQNMENVYEINPQTEQGSKINQEVNVGSADLGKFKDVNALLQAYQSLQAEFTRRSQRLKRYQEQENQRREASLSSGNGSDADNEKNRAEKFDDLESATAPYTEINAAPSTQSGKLDTAEIAVEEPQSQADALCDDGVRPCSATEEKITESEDGETFAAQSGSADHDTVNKEKEIQTDRVREQSAQSLYELAAANEEVRLRIVGDYLSSIGKSNAPFVRGGASALVTPPKKPRNLADAGNMALAYLKAYKEQV